MKKPNEKKLAWNPPDWLDSPTPGTMLVHDEEVGIYEGYVLIEGIKLYRDNNRTSLDLTHLLEQLGVGDIKNLTDKDIIDYILKQGLHKIQELAGSIKKNGVKVPLVLTFDKGLIDGNRRFLACQYLIQNEKPDEKFTKVLARCLPPKLNKELRLKIISEENFLPDFKEPWPREVRAKFAVERYEEFLKEYKNEEEAYKQVKYFLDIGKQDVQRFQSVLDMIKEYVDYAKNHITKTKQDVERFARTKFHFFEEFYNKTSKGPNRIRSAASIKEANELLYKYILNDQLSSTMRVRELAEIVRYEPTKKYLQKPNASFEVARSNYQDYARPKKAALKIIHFCEWIEGLSVEEEKEISSSLRKRLSEAVKKLGE